MSFLGHVVRFVVAAIVLMVTNLLVPTFSVGGFWSALILAIVIALVGWIVEVTVGHKVTPFGRGIVGFMISAIVIYIAGQFVPDVSVTLLGAVLAALVVGLIDLFIPITSPFELRSKSR